MLSIPGAEKRVLMFTAASKTFNIPGLQQAMAVCFNADMLKRLADNMEAQGITSGNVFALPATQAAYTQCDDWLDGMLAYLDESRVLLRQTLDELLPRAVLTPVFGPENGDGFMRLNFACPHAALKEGVRRMADALTE